MFFDIFKKKKRIELPYEYTNFSKAYDYNHVFIYTPNPITQRDYVYSINGLSHMTINDSKLLPSEYKDTVFIPFPIGSILSNTKRTYKDNNYYHIRREFSLKDFERKDRVFLRLMKIEGEFVLHLNGVNIYEGIDSLDLEIEVTDVINREINELVISIKEDPKRAIIGPSGPIYLETSGLSRINKVSITKDLDEKTILFNIDSDIERGYIEITSPSSITKKYEFEGNTCLIQLRDLAYWDIDRPFFYQYKVIMDGDNREYIRGVFHISEFRIGKSQGIDCFKINDNPYPIKGILDDYYYSDGLTMPSSEDFILQLFKTVKDCGFNTIRKTNYIDIPSYYYKAITFGLLIAQDITYNKATFINTLNYLNKFDSIIMINIKVDKNTDLVEVYNEAKKLTENKVIIVSNSKDSYGDAQILDDKEKLYKTKSKKPNKPYFQTLSFGRDINRLKEFMEDEYIPSSLSSMVGFFFKSVNGIEDGLFNQNYSKIRVKIETIRNIIK